MRNLNRQNAIRDISTSKSPIVPDSVQAGIADYGCDVFNAEVMRDYLPKETCSKLLQTIEKGKPLNPAIAGDVAHAMKEWAVARGATSYTHWFQPLTGGTAEKHDSFLEPNGSKALFAFSGKNLIIGEPDASSFPSGGLRSTFEARGYTAWDPTSPAFIKRHDNGATLCIPTAFCSYTGEALDKKTPLLRSIQALSAATRRLMQCFGCSGNGKVTVTLGVEQEYFLIDKHFFLLRPDLIQTGRTLFGAPPAKHQQLEDHYFGAIRPRVLNFMSDVEQTLWKLGIPAKTRHNEVAPAQFELAPVFEEVNLACDHNMLVMEILRQTAEKHGFVCLLHEKPFAGVNGSGKHNNWSINYEGRNLLNPGSNPQDDAIFLTVLCAIIEAVDLHADLLRCAVSGAGNDHRLGANEAPPAIISMYLGDQLEAILEQLEQGSVQDAADIAPMKVGVDTLPPLPRDATDRNRTSPFAFTGNKFEFRAPGSSQSCSGANIILNVIVAEAFDRMSDFLSGVKNADFHEELQSHLQAILKAHKRVIFNGDGYTQSWLEEAARRGLPHTRTTMESLKCLTSPENVQLFEKYRVFSRRELESRFEVGLEDYHRKIRIEGKTALEIATSQIIPGIQQQYLTILHSLRLAQETGVSSGVEALRSQAVILGEGLDRLQLYCDKLRQALSGLHEEILAAMENLRGVADGLEAYVADENWPLPKYHEMLFVY